MINVNKLRKILGWLAILLPWISAILYMIFEIKSFSLPHSISDTYYYDSCIVPFMIILGSAGILLICYNGYDKQDDIICTIAGILGLCICLFPCSDLRSSGELVGTFKLPVKISGILHYISAISFFGLLAYNSLFLFTKTSGEITLEKKKRNLIFRICGIGMVVSFALVIPLKLLGVFSAIWIVEAIALAFFGISWLTKSQCYSWLFKDKN